MKKTVCALISLVLLFGILLVSCSPKEELPEAADSHGSEAVESTEEETLSNDPVTVKETYLPSNLSKQVRTIFEGKQDTFNDYSASSAPYSMSDVFSISNCRLLSITIPVCKTGAIDFKGNFVFTLYVVGNSYEGLCATPKEIYHLDINASEHDLSENNASVYRWLTVDLSDYDIELAEDETLAFYSPEDTIVPAFMSQDSKNTHKLLTVMKEQFPQITGFFNKVGSGAVTPSVSTLFYDFEWERTYESEAAYQAVLNEQTEYDAMVQALKKKYEGAYVSILGDSISTFNGISNNAKINSTIGGNAVWFPSKNTNVMHEGLTYWGRLIEDMGMRLCVNNSWSGSRAYGAAGTGAGNMLGRATQLHRDNGTQTSSDDTDPNLIFVYIGINDLHNSNAVPFGDLYNILSKNDGRSDYEKIDAWFATVLAQAEQSGTVKQGSTYKTFEQAYALSLNAMRERYSAAEIYCITYTQNMDTRCTAEKLDQYNTCVKALASYFDMGVIDQAQGYVNGSNMHAYSNDTQYLHPNAAGHKLITRLIVETLYKNL